MNGQAGKGSRRRPTDEQAYAAGYARIFRKPRPKRKDARRRKERP